MAFVTVPKDLSKVKSKIAFNLTKRQLLCFGAAAAVGIPFYIATKDALGTSTSGIFMVLIMLPFFFLAMYEKDGLPFEKIMGNFFRFLRREQVRTYQTDNLYRQLEELEIAENMPARNRHRKHSNNKNRKGGAHR